MHNNQKGHYKKLKQKIIKILICFPNLKLFNPPFPSFTKAFANQFCVGKCPVGAGYCVPPLTSVFPSGVNIFYHYA